MSQPCKGQKEESFVEEKFDEVLSNKKKLEAFQKFRED